MVMSGVNGVAPVLRTVPAPCWVAVFNDNLGGELLGTNVSASAFREECGGFFGLEGVALRS